MLPPTVEESSFVLRHVVFNEATFPYAHPGSLFSSSQNNNFVATYEELFEWQYPLKNDSRASKMREVSNKQHSYVKATAPRSPRFHRMTSCNYM